MINENPHMPEPSDIVAVMAENMAAAQAFATKRDAETALLALSAGHLFGNTFNSEVV